MKMQIFFIILVIIFVLCIVPSYSAVLLMKGQNNPYTFKTSALKQSFTVPTEISQALYCQFDITQGSINVNISIGSNPYNAFDFNKSPTNVNTQFVITSENFKTSINVYLMITATGNFTSWSGNISCHTLRQTNFTMNYAGEFQVPMKSGEIGLLKSSPLKLNEEQYIDKRIFISVRIGLALGCGSGDMPHFVIFSNHYEFNRGSLKNKLTKEEIHYKSEFCEGLLVDFPTGEIYVIVQNTMPNDTFYYPRMGIFECPKDISSFFANRKRN